MALGVGVMNNPAVYRKAKRVHVYDLFKAYEHQVANLFPKMGVTNIRVGDDFSHLYRKHVEPIKNALSVNVGDIRDVQWTKADIEILFMDCATTPNISVTILQKFFPFLIPGLSLVINQDFFFERAWWFPYMAEVFSDFLTPEYAEDCTLVSKCVADPDLSKLDLDGDTVTILQAMERFAARLDSAARQKIQLQQAWFLCERGEPARAKEIAARILSHPIDQTVRYRANNMLRFIDSART